VATESATRRTVLSDEGGFTILELLISVAILMVVSGLVMQGTLDMSRLSAQQSNRSEMHAGIRNATALLQQEVGQAGRMALPAPVTLTGGIVAGSNPQWVNVTSVAEMFPGLRLVVGLGSPGDPDDAEEIVTIAPNGVDAATNRILATFRSNHVAGAPVRPAGGFASGVIPTTDPNGSTASVLKIFGDINSDGRLMYVEYTCDWEDGRLYRNMVRYNAASKPALTAEQVLLDNLLPNPPDPDGTIPPCFTYEEQTIGGRTYVVNVAIMTTVRTDERDPVTREFQTVTKALLNVAPRNVYHVWQIASLNYENRIQPLPASVAALLP
jgi:type II secretory pathway pseudopilin PulG